MDQPSPSPKPATPTLQRRRFLQASSLAPLAAFAGGSLRAETKPAPSGDAAPSTTHPIYRAVKLGADPGAAELEKVASLGFHGVELNGGEAVPDALRVRRDAQAAGLHVHGVVGNFHWETRLSDPDPDTRAKAVSLLESAVEHAHAVGGSSVLLVPGAVRGENETHDDVWNRSLEGIHKVLPKASWYGIHILVETVWNGFCEQPDQFRDYLDEAASPWVAAYLDFGNMQKFAPSEDWFRVLAHRVVKIDVKDWGVEPSFCALGEGDVDWPAVRLAMREIGFTGWVTREGSDGSLENTARLMDELLLASD
jgi:L-ribulose-5-phosphate 3-epimerase